MSLQYVWRLSAPERPSLTRIAKGRGGCPRPAQVRCGIGGRGVDGRSRRGRAGRRGRPRRPRAPEAVWKRPAKAPRSSRRDGAGEAHLLQWAQSMPPAGQARGTLRGIVPRIRYETVRCMI